MKKVVLLLLKYLFALPLLFLTSLQAQTMSNEGKTDPGYWRQKLEEFKNTEDNFFRLKEGRSDFYGLFGGLDYNMHQADFKELGQDVSACCPENYSNSESINFGFGLLYEHPISKYFGAVIGLGYNQFGTDFLTTETFPYNFDGIKKTGYIDHELKTNLSTLFLRPAISYEFLPKFIFSIGFEAGFLVSKSFDQREILRVDDPWAFSNDSLVRNVISGDIPNASSVNYGITGGLGYEIPLNKTGNFYIVPEMTYYYQLNNIASGLSWKANSIRFGVSLKYSPEATIDTSTFEEKQRFRVLDSMKIISSLKDAIRDSTLLALKDLEKNISGNALIADIESIKSRNDEGQETSITSINVEETYVSNCNPLLNYIFFDKGSSIIPKRYAKVSDEERYNFHEDKLINNNAVETYHHLLNIVGRRMDQHSDAVLTIIGCIDNKGIEENDTVLSYRRAMEVSYYLQTIWKIPESRIKIEKRGLPEKYTESIDPKGIEENRRVELSSDNPEILKPIFKKEYIKAYVKPEKIRTYLNVFAGAGISDLFIKIEDNLGMEKKIYLDSIPKFIEWNFRQDAEIIPNKTKTIQFNLYMLDKNGADVRDIQPLPVEYVSIQNKSNMGVIDTVFEEYTILLPFEDPGMTEYENEIVEWINESVKKHSANNIIIDVTGYTDILGKKEKNIELAYNRAIKVRDFIKYRNVNVNTAPLSNKYDNDFPEGRFYNRSVDIQIKYLKEF